MFKRMVYEIESVQTVAPRRGHVQEPGCVATFRFERKSYKQ